MPGDLLRRQLPERFGPYIARDYRFRGTVRGRLQGADGWELLRVRHGPGHDSQHAPVGRLGFVAVLRPRHANAARRAEARVLGLRSQFGQGGKVPRQQADVGRSIRLSGLRRGRRRFRLGLRDRRSWRRRLLLALLLGPPLDGCSPGLGLFGIRDPVLPSVADGFAVDAYLGGQVLVGDLVQTHQFHQSSAGENHSRRSGGRIGSGDLRHVLHQGNQSEQHELLLVFRRTGTCPVVRRGKHHASPFVFGAFGLWSVHGTAPSSASLSRIARALVHTSASKPPIRSAHSSRSLSNSRISDTAADHRG